MINLERYSENTFDSIKHINEYGQEFWSARELANILEYSDYRNFLVAIDKAMQACKNSGQVISDHFGEATKMVSLGSDAKRNNAGKSSYSRQKYKTA